MAESEVVDNVMLQPMPKHVFIGIDELSGIATFLASPPPATSPGRPSWSTEAGRRSESYEGDAFAMKLATSPTRSAMTSSICLPVSQPTKSTSGHCS